MLLLMLGTITAKIHCGKGFVIATQVLAEDATESKGATLLSQTNIILYSKRCIPMLKIDRGLKSKRVYAPLLLLSMYT